MSCSYYANNYVSLISNLAALPISTYLRVMKVCNHCLHLLSLSEGINLMEDVIAALRLEPIMLMKVLIILFFWFPVFCCYIEA